MPCIQPETSKNLHQQDDCDICEGEVNDGDCKHKKLAKIPVPWLVSEDEIRDARSKFYKRWDRQGFCRHFEPVPEKGTAIKWKEE